MIKSKAIFRIIISFFIIILNSCSNEENHKITWHIWINSNQTKLLKFTPDGKFYDLYNFSNTQFNKYEVGEKNLNIKNYTFEPKDSIQAEILYLDEEKLVIKYKDNSIDSLKKASDKDYIIGSWAPIDMTVPQDTFILGFESYDCTFKSADSSKKRYFRYKLINDTKAVFDFYMENRKDSVTYSISKDGLMLMLNYGDYITTLKRY